MQINILDARNRLSALIRSARMGREVIIANRGEPVARLVPVERVSEPAPRRDIVAWLKQHPLPPHAQRPAAELDSAIAAERAAWD